MFPTFDDIKGWYDNGYWTVEMVQTAVELSRITQEQADEILKERDGQV